MNEKIIIIAVLAVLVTLQYWRGRRLNLKLIRKLSSSIEDAFQPVEKEYTWIGGYAGIVADYKLNEENYTEAKVTVSLLPRHSLLYFPISLLRGKRDRVQMLIKRDRPIHYNDIHIKTGKWVKTPENVSNLEVETRKIKGSKVKCWYANKNTAEVFMKLLQMVKRPGGIKHLTVNKEEKAFYVELQITHNTPADFINNFLEWKM